MKERIQDGSDPAIEVKYRRSARINDLVMPFVEFSAFRRIDSLAIRDLEKVTPMERSVWQASHRSADDIALLHKAIRESGAASPPVGPAKEAYWRTSWKTGIAPHFTVGRAMEPMGSFPVSPPGESNMKMDRRAMAIMEEAGRNGITIAGFPEQARYPKDLHEIQVLASGFSRVSRTVGFATRVLAMAYAPSDEEGHYRVGMVVGESIPPPEKGRTALLDHVEDTRREMQTTYNEAMELVGLEPTTEPGEWSVLE